MAARSPYPGVFPIMNATARPRVQIVRKARIPNKRLKQRRGSVKGPAYRAFVRSFGCIACFGELIPPDELGPLECMLQGSRTECAHVGARGLSQKASDYDSLPLCAIEHHRVGPESHHKLGKRFWGFHGLNRVELIHQLQELWKTEVLGSTAKPRGEYGGAR
jgi:hypothetical protein